MLLPEASTNEAVRAARNTFSPGNLSGEQIIAATITETKVIRKFKGRMIFIIAVSCSVNSIKMLVRDLPKLTKRKRNDALRVSEKLQFVRLSLSKPDILK